MRILMLAQFYPPIVGGEEHHVENLSIELAARGHKVSVATLWKEGLPEFECRQGVCIHRIRGSMQRMSAIFSDLDRRHLPPFPDPEMLWALLRRSVRTLCMPMTGLCIPSHLSRHGVKPNSLSRFTMLVLFVPSSGSNIVKICAVVLN